ncbi:hypothetical protein QYE76_064343 [Lolium multiflorum]|uniref:Uncharacterized protein n=1 Tax=Lolium multiflorum TaxID=4521 RepID=A0AAD8S7H5_LOLMU|nr:hypothetical protein QYE76_064343 [Lolium multiflorum]
MQGKDGAFECTALWRVPERAHRGMGVYWHGFGHGRSGQCQGLASRVLVPFESLCSVDAPGQEESGRSVNLPSNEGRQHEASLQVIRRSLLDESRELIDHASKLRDVNAHLVNRAMKLWNEYAVLLNEHSSLSKENSSLSKENLSMVNQNGSLTKENISILKENSSLKKENISILKENSSLKKEHTYYKWRSMTGNK